jgi:hypothetical protein
MRPPDVWYLKEQLDTYLATPHNAPVSTILLQENSFKPALTSGLFFLPLIFLRAVIAASY